jgi:hypothetical protein
MTDMTDPRVTEFQNATADVRAGLRGSIGSHDRYRAALTPYVECIAEITPDEPLARKAMMSAMFEDGLPLGVIAFAFKATVEEANYVVDHPPLEPEPIDEQERLAALPYPLYLRTPHWRSVRKQALQRAEGRCIICSRADTLEVHHRYYGRMGAERPADVTVLCSLCHTRHHAQLRAVA